MKKINKIYLLMAGIILLGLAFTISTGTAQDNGAADDKSKNTVENITPFDGSIGPASALYGLKIAVENLREGFTFNERQKLVIQLEHAKERIAEAKAELGNRNDDAANRAMDQFVEKVQAVDDRLTGIDRNDSGLLEAQKEIVKHQLMLEHLLDDYPNNTGLRRAFNNSLKLEDRFESKTERSIVPVVSRDGVALRQAGREELQDIERGIVQVEAKIVGNDTEAKVRVKFVSTSSDPNATAQEILDKLQLNKTEIDNVLEIQVVDFEELIERLEAKARAGRGITEAEAEFRFPLLKTTNRTDIINGISQKLSLLTKDRILNSMEFRIRDRRVIREINESEDIEVRAKIIGNATEARVRVEFVTNRTDLTAVSQEITDKLNLSKTAIDNLLEIETAQRDDLRERQEARISSGKISDLRREDRGIRAAALELKEGEPGDDRGGAREAEIGDDRGGGKEVQVGDDRGKADDVRKEDRREDIRDKHSEIGIGNNFSEVEFELEFVLNTVNRTEIVDGIFQKLSALSVQDVLNSLENARLEIKQKREGRKEQEASRGSEAERGGGSGRGGGNSGRD